LLSLERLEHMDALGELTCGELVELVTDYLEGGLTPEERMRFEKHLLICEGCSAYLDQVRKTIEIVGSLQEDSIPPQMRDKLLEAFRTWKVGDPSGGGESA
jgi:predicted anti-sigma-YlaC factor YlaD